MAIKPKAQLSEAYRRRVERAEAKGLTRQAARGHKAKEHIARKEREVNLGLLTSSQRQAVRKFAREQWARAERDGEDESEFLDQMMDWAVDGGYERFGRLRAKERALHRQYRSELKAKTYASRGLEWLIAETARHEAPDYTWLYYH